MHKICQVISVLMRSREICKKKRERKKYIRKKRRRIIFQFVFSKHTKRKPLQSLNYLELDKRPTWQMIRFVFLSAITGSSQQYITPFKNHPTILKSRASPSRWPNPPASEQTVPTLLDDLIGITGGDRSRMALYKCNKRREAERICID